MSLFNWKSPIPDEVKDTKQLGDYIREWRLIPYYGTMEKPSHSFLRLIRDLCELSPTHQTVRRAMKRYAFGLNVSVVNRTYPGLKNQEETELEYSQQLAWAMRLQEIGLSLQKIIDCSKKMDDHISESGNTYLMIRRSNEGGETTYHWEVLHYLNTAYTTSEDEGEEFVLHSAELDTTTLAIDDEPEIFRVTPIGEPIRWMEEEDGSESTVFHLKDPEGSDPAKYYARSPVIASLTMLFTDFKHYNHMSIAANAPMKAQKLIAVEGEDPNSFNGGLGGDDDKNVKDQFERDVLVIKQLLTSLESKGQRIGPQKDDSEVAVVQYPFGGKPPTFIDMEVMRDPKYLQFQGDATQKAIAAMSGWDLTLTALRDAKASLGGNLLYDTFAVVNVETIKPKQNFFENFWNQTIGQVMEEEGAAAEDVMKGIRFNESVEELIEGIKPAPSTMIPGEEEITETGNEEQEDDDEMSENDIDNE